MVGNPRVRSAYAPQPWSRRLLSLFLALALALTLTPLPAWGDETGDAPTEALASKAFADSATTSEAPETEPQASDEGATFSDSSFVTITKDSAPTKPNPYSVNNGMKPGLTLHATAWADKNTLLQPGDSWSYQWFVGDKNGSSIDLDSFIPLEGATESALTLTNNLCSEYEGKYLRVQITSNETVISGPKKATKYTSDTACGPIIAPEAPVKQIKLDYVLLSWNGSGFGNELESVPDCNEGDTLEACAYSFEDPYTLYGASDVVFSWQVSDSQYGAFEEVGQGASFTVAENYAGRYLKVVATAKNGIPGSNTCETKSGKILPKGVTTLYRVSILDASSSKEVGCTLQAQAYKGDYWSSAPVNTGVEYTWRWSTEKPSASGFSNSSWHVIEGATGPSFTVPDSLEGCWVSVTAYAGDNTVTSANASAAGPFRKPGTHELYYAALEQTPQDDSFVFWSGRTIGVTARETSAAGTAGNYLSSDQLTYTWYIADSWDGEYVELSDENVHKASFVVPDSYVGKHLKCLVSAGFNTLEAGPMRKAVAQGEAVEPVDPTPPQPEEPTSATVTARIVGVSPHAVGDAYQMADWVPSREYVVADSTKTSAWDIFADLLDKAGYFYSLDGGCPYSITTPDRSQTLAMSAGAPWSYWSFLINGEYADVMASGHHPQDGDVLELVYVDATGSAAAPDIAVKPNAPAAEWAADWGSFGTATGAPIAVDSTLGSLPSRWTYDFAQSGYASWSEPVVAGGFVFFATGSRLLELDASTGAVVAEAPLADGTAYGCRPIYAKGLVVPLNNGRLQALSALTLQTRWLTEALPAAVQEVASGSEGGAASVTYDQQGLSTLTVSGDYLYAFTAAADWSQTYEGWALCVNASTGAIRWMQKNTDAGYYWSGAASVGDYLVAAGDDGMLQAVSAASTDGEPVATLALGAPVRSTVVTVDGFAYVVTTNGTLHKVSVGANGALTQVGAVSFGDYSTSTPALADGVLYVGGSQNGQGLLAAIDAATLALTATVTAADGSPLPGEVKSTPLLVRDSAGVVALFTCNGAGGSWPDYTSGGGVFAYRLGDQEAQLVFDPPAGMHNYAMASVAYGGAGTFCYVNDSGHLFALGLSSQPPAPRPSTDSETPGEPQNPETPQKPESPTGPGKSDPKNPTSQNAGTTSLGTSANGKTPMAGAGSGAPLNAGAAARTPFDTTVLQGSSNTRAAAAGTDADAGGVAPDRIAEAVADNPTPLAKASGANIDRVSSVASNSSLAEGAATENGNQTAAVALALLSVAGLLGAAYLVRGPRRRIDKETGSHDA
ncbi:PQQ-binding-like beta-propeller repeat protein [Adlercreutzia equolifaciens]|uniref:PQQ-binding-like beta-propeller repeat protein n=1 Tax=Adlercreutzia equolifaciens TaxID=446660 RepID=UPI003AEFE057